jgi:predicted  nucleic acid-binding Zn-ribbon protein
MDSTFKTTPMTAEIQYRPPNQQPANTTYNSDKQTTTAADPLSASAKQKRGLEAMQRAMTKWTADIDKWQSKIEAIKEELECSDQRVRKLSEENRAHLRKLSKKEAEVIGMRMN